eukprot:m.94182 g.94182  ORF g.94182 m.94182 type:complete len:605 (-) comp13018_c0_seq1:197-2011(-)
MASALSNAEKKALTAAIKKLQKNLARLNLEVTEDNCIFALHDNFDPLTRTFAVDKAVEQILTDSEMQKPKKKAAQTQDKGGRGFGRGRGRGRGQGGRGRGRGGFDKAAGSEAVRTSDKQFRGERGGRGRGNGTYSRAQKQDKGDVQQPVESQEQEQKQKKQQQQKQFSGPSWASTLFPTQKVAPPKPVEKKEPVPVIDQSPVEAAVGEVAQVTAPEQVPEDVAVWPSISTSTAVKAPAGVWGPGVLATPAAETQVEPEASPVVTPATEAAWEGPAQETEPAPLGEQWAQEPVPAPVEEAEPEPEQPATEGWAEMKSEITAPEHNAWSAFTKRATAVSSDPVVGVPGLMDQESVGVSFGYDEADDTPPSPQTQPQQPAEPVLEAPIETVQAQPEPVQQVPQVQQEERQPSPVVQPAPEPATNVQHTAPPMSSAPAMVSVPAPAPAKTSEAPQAGLQSLPPMQPAERHARMGAYPPYMMSDMSMSADMMRAYNFPPAAQQEQRYDDRRHNRDRAQQPPNPMYPPYMVPPFFAPHYYAYPRMFMMPQDESNGFDDQQQQPQQQPPQHMQPPPFDMRQAYQQGYRESAYPTGGYGGHGGHSGHTQKWN